MTVTFELDGPAFTALSGGLVFTFNEAISFQDDSHRAAQQSSPKLPLLQCGMKSTWRTIAF